MAEESALRHVREICRLIEDHRDEPLTLDDLGTAVGLSPYHLQRLFKRITGISPRQYADACRLGVLKARLKERRTVITALFEAGYGSTSRLYERASAQLGMTPATYKRGGKGMSIRYSVNASPLGRLLLGVTERGICAVYLGAVDGPLETALNKEYPAAAIERANGEPLPWLKELLEHLAGQRPHLELPLDVQATAFQWRVWQELRQIPYGQTRTYSEIAAALGQPKAVRAVGRACATNPVSVVIPCHRVLRGDGSLGGYRWGLDRKEALLRHERTEVEASQEEPAGGKA
jgi:AraC family transcriptional regulator, regulatory protein of adaptative response / methylated-DNA-[protein]-cysteine methyltransferase